MSSVAFSVEYSTRSELSNAIGGDKSDRREVAILCQSIQHELRSMFIKPMKGTVQETKSKKALVQHREHGTITFYCIACNSYPLLYTINTGHFPIKSDHSH